MQVGILGCRENEESKKQDRQGGRMIPIDRDEKRTRGFLLLPVALSVAVFGGILPLWLLHAITRLPLTVLNLIAVIWVMALATGTVYLVCATIMKGRKETGQ